MHLLRLPAVIAATGLSRSSIYRAEAAGRFPARLRVSERVTAWRCDELDRWLSERPRAVEQRASPIGLE